MTLFSHTSGNRDSVQTGVRGLIVLLGFLIQEYLIPFIQRRAVSLPDAASFYWVESGLAWLPVLWFSFVSVRPWISITCFLLSLCHQTVKAHLPLLSCLFPPEAVPSQIVSCNYFLVPSFQFLSSRCSDLPVSDLSSLFSHLGCVLLVWDKFDLCLTLLEHRCLFSVRCLPDSTPAWAWEPTQLVWDVHFSTYLQIEVCSTLCLLVL